MTTHQSGRRRSPGAGRRARFQRLGILTIVLWLCVTPSASAGAVSQGGRYASVSTISNQLTSTAARMISASPSSGSCVIVSVLISGGSNQLETGLTRCNNLTIDGTCVSGQAFVETSMGNGFACYPHGAFALGSYYSIGVAKRSVEIWAGQIAGTNYEIINSGWPSTVTARTWGEWTTAGSQTCSGWSASGQFTGWTYRTDSGSTVGFTDSTTSVAPGCWTVGSISGAAYNVSH